MRAGLTEVIQATRPNEVWAIDIVGRMNESNAGNQWILTMIDCFTRWPITVAIRNRTQETVMEAIYEHMVTARGRPDKIVTDQGKELVGAAVKALCERWGIRKVQTGGYNPRGNASIERTTDISWLH
jgi:transposase InsO family protein